MNLPDAVRIAHGVAAALAVALAWRRRDCVALALFLSGTALASLIRGVLRGAYPWLLGPVQHDVTTTMRVVVPVDAALYLTWSAGLAALALETMVPGRAAPVERSSDPRPLPPRRSVTWLPAAGWAIIVAVLAGFYVRAPHTRSVYLLADLLAIAVAVGAFMTAARDRVRPTLAVVAVIAILSAHATALGVTWVGDGFARWPIALGSYLGLYGFLCSIFGGALWRKSV